MSYLWPLAGLIASLFSAGYMVTNQYIKIPGWKLIWFMRLSAVVIIMPVFLITGFINDPIFYAAVFATVFLAMFADIVTINLVQDYGSGPVSRLKALSIPVSFVLWSIIDLSSVTDLINNPLPGIGIILALGMATYFLLQLKACNVSREVIKKMLPIILLCYAPIDTLNKTAMLHAPVLSGPLHYIFFQSLGISIFLTIYYQIKGRNVEEPSIKQPYSRRNVILLVAVFIFFYLATMFFKNVGMRFTPNPAFVMLMIRMSPFWIILLNKRMKYSDDTDIKSGVGLVLAALAIVVFNSFVR